MKRFAVVAFASFALSLGACDDEDTKRTDARVVDSGQEGGSEAGSEGGAPGQCVGSFADTNRTALGAVVASKPAAQCKSSADLDLICASDIGGKIRNEYAKSCLPSLNLGSAAVVSCIEMGVKRDFPSLSSGCLGCYTASVVCTLDKCLLACANDATSLGCQNCQLNQGCLAAFFNCSGLPGGPTTDAGTPDAPDAPGDAGDDAPDGGVDSPVDSAEDAADDAASDVADDTGSDI